MADFFGRQQFGTEHFNPMKLPSGQPHPSYYPGFESAPKPGVLYSAPAGRPTFTTAISGGVLFSTKQKRK